MKMKVCWLFAVVSVGCNSTQLPLDAKHPAKVTVREPRASGAVRVLAMDYVPPLPPASGNAHQHHHHHQPQPSTQPAPAAAPAPTTQAPATAPPPTAGPTSTPEQPSNPHEGHQH